MFVRRSTYEKLFREALETKIAALELQAKYEELKRGMGQIAELLGEDPPQPNTRHSHDVHKLHKLRLVVNNVKD